MLFIVRVGTIVPYHGPTSDSLGFAIGVVEARSKAEAARLLGLIQWDGWKNIPNVNKKNWSKWGKCLYFTRFDTRNIDRSPNAYRNSSRRMRYITLTRTKQLTEKIPNSVWEMF